MPGTSRPFIEPIEWRTDELRFIDQTRLPAELVVESTGDYREVGRAIRRLALRGAPLIGIAGAYALALAARDRSVNLGEAANELAATRPTAVNLRWAIARVLQATREHSGRDRGLIAGIAECEAIRIHRQQIEDDLRMGQLGAALIEPGSTLLTHCNTGSLATGGIGTALGVIKTAHRQGKDISVLADETRPLLQGARLTAWEIERDAIPYRLIVDGAAAGIIASGGAQAVLVGADRIAANGDVANKVGTYGLALAAHAHGVPFYVVAPSSTVDLATADGSAIPIEERDGDEVTAFGDLRTAPESAIARNPAFDITPARYITAIITEHAALRPPFDCSLRAVVRDAAVLP